MKEREQACQYSCQIRYGFGEHVFLLKYQNYLCNNFDILRRNLFFPFLMGFKDIAIDPDLDLRPDFAVCFQIDSV